MTTKDEMESRATAVFFKLFEYLMLGLLVVFSVPIALICLPLICLSWILRRLVV